VFERVVIVRHGQAIQDAAGVGFGRAISI